MKNTFNVSELSKLAGVSVRTLHHYDQIGLLKPSRRRENGYREYTEDQLIILQQILIYRALDFSTSKVKEIICAKDIDLTKILDDQKSLLLSRQEEIQSMINSIEVAMNDLQRTKNYEALYRGIPKENAERWDELTRDRYGSDFFESALQNIADMDETEINRIRAEGSELGKAFAKSVDRPAESTPTQDLAGQYHKWLESFLAATNEGFKVANSKVVKHYAEMLNVNEELTEFYDRYGPGTASYLSKALTYFAEKSLD